MNIHQCARTTPRSRALLVHRALHERQPAAQAARALGISRRTVFKWLARYRAGGLPALADRPSTPHRQPTRLGAEWLARVEQLRRQRWTGPRIARALGLPRSTVGRHLRRLGLGRLRALEAPPPPVRYERAHPGELVHLDIKPLGRIRGVGHRIHGDRATRQRGIGWEYLHVAIDDASRLAYAEVLPRQHPRATCGFVRRALTWYARHGVRVARLMTDNGNAYRSHPFSALCRRRGLRQVYTRPYRPCTNGKAERFIQTALREWAYAAAYASSAQRRTALAPWLASYNTERPHTALHDRPPITRVRDVNNVLGNHT
jgi:transposase InsO family protein